MDISLQPQLSKQQSYSGSKIVENAPVSADTNSSLRAKSSYTQDKVEIPNVEKVEAVRASIPTLEDTYVVSDSTFTIFKDGSGELITRIRSLRDGSVTYIPDPDLQSFDSGAAIQAAVEVTV